MHSSSSTALLTVGTLRGRLWHGSLLLRSRQAICALSLSDGGLHLMFV